MKKTIKLFDQNAYETEFKAVVVSCEKVEKENGTLYQVVLDQTLFFPEEGGQSPDQGYIDDIEVVDVQIKEDIITHTLTAPLLVGKEVFGKVDWKHRFNNMQQHSGEHIFSGLVHRIYGYDNVGFHLSNQIVTLDFNGVLTHEQAAEIEYMANEVIVKNLKVEVSYPSKEELAKMDYRSKIEIAGQVRIVTIPGVDVCACCAPHVRTTGEIGMLKIMTMQNYKGGVRISILCGFRALEDYRMRVQTICQISNLLSSNQENLYEAVCKVKDTNTSLKQELNQVKQAYMEAKIAMISEAKEDVYFFEEDLDTNTMRKAVNQLVEEHSGVCGVFSGNDTEGYRFILGSSAKDVRQVMETLNKTFKAKGGGSNVMVQGSVMASKERILSSLEYK